MKVGEEAVPPEPDVDALLAAALRQPPEARAAFLEAACEGHPELRATLEKLLRESDDVDPFLRPGGALDGPLGEDLLGNLRGQMAAASVSDRSLATVAMPRRRAPWWLFIVASSFPALFALRIYSTFWGPEPLGVTADFTGRGMLLRTVTAESPAARAGLKPGDRVVAVDAQRLHSRIAWITVTLNLEVGRPHRLQIERGSDRLETILTLERSSSETWTQQTWILMLGWGAKLITLILAFVIGFKRSHDPVALVGALFLAALATGDYLVPSGMAATWRDLPMPVGLLLWIAFLSSLAFGPLLLTFFAMFPRQLFQRRWPWLVMWTPALVLLSWLVSLLHRMVYRPNRAIGDPDWLLTTFIWAVVMYILGGLIALVVNYRRLETANERRRVRVVVAGSVVGLLAGVPGVVTLYLAAPGLASAVFSVPGVILQLIAFLAFPLSLAYAILRHRLFDIRLIVRQGIQYALARRLLLSVVPALGGVLLLDLMLHREQSMMDAVRARGWIYAGVGAVALTAQAQRRRWLDGLDRRFFREPYNAQQLLRAVVEEVRGAGAFEQVAPRVVMRIEAALHPEFAGILSRDSRTTSYRVLAVAPSEHAMRPLAADSKLVALVRLLGKPLEVNLSESAWLTAQLPDHEVEVLRQTRIDLVVPITAQHERVALMVLGAKRSEEPYSREDQELLATTATNLSLLLEKPAAAPKVSDTFEECPECGKCYDVGTARCPEQGIALLPVALPKVLAGRYRLERRLGRGGMATVYEATDTGLERIVAVKVIREDLLASPDAAERFRREARATAGFAHPNVVAVYDFGFATEARAFLVMERLNGRTLREELGGEGHLPAYRALEILRGVCAAIDAAHCGQLIHRDLKPENIFLCRDRSSVVAKVLDFGVAKFLPLAMHSTAETASGALVGTLRYMAPEQLRGEPPKASWDIWALGVITYEMLSGEHPYANENPLEWPAALMAGRWAPVREHLSEAPVQWQQFFERVFAPEIERRPASAVMFLSELESALV